MSLCHQHPFPSLLHLVISVPLRSFESSVWLLIMIELWVHRFGHVPWQRNALHKISSISPRSILQSCYRNPASFHSILQAFQSNKDLNLKFLSSSLAKHQHSCSRKPKYQFRKNVLQEFSSVPGLHTVVGVLLPSIVRVLLQSLSCTDG